MTAARPVVWPIIRPAVQSAFEPVAVGRRPTEPTLTEQIKALVAKYPGASAFDLQPQPAAA